MTDNYMTKRYVEKIEKENKELQQEKENLIKYLENSIQEAKEIRSISNNINAWNRKINYFTIILEKVKSGKYE